MRYILSFVTVLCCLTSLGQDKYVVAGDRLMEKLSFLEALEKYQISYIYNEDYISSKRIAATYFVLQRYTEAEKWFNKTLQFKNVSIEDHINLLKCYLALNKVNESVALCNQLLLENPSSKKLILIKALCQSLLESSDNTVKGKERKVDYCIDLQAVEDSSMLGPDVTIEWLFDDGVLKLGNKVKHCFKTPGKHSVTLSSIDKTFDVITRSDTTISLFFLEALNFDITGLAWIDASVKLDGRKLAYRPNIFGVIWQTGDGNIYFDEVFTHKYLLKGNYNITLTIIAEENGSIYPAGSITRNWNVINR